MFSSIASFIFGSSTTESTNSKSINGSELREVQNCNLTEEDSKTSETIAEYQQVTSNSNKSKNRKDKNNKHVQSKIKPVNSGAVPTLNGIMASSSDDEFDLSDDWFFVEKEYVDSLSSKEELSLADHYNRTSPPIPNISDFSKLHQRNICNNSYQQHLSTLSKFHNTPSETDVDGSNKPRFLTDCSVVDPLHTVVDNKDLGHNLSSWSFDSNGSGAKLFTMVDSWYMTPPPCFVSTGPIYMEMTPLENLLIEHPSMSIYHSIKAAQKSSDCFVNNSSDLHQKRQEKENFKPQESQAIICLKPSSILGQNQNKGKGAKTPRIDHCNATKLKMELFAMNSQKSLAICDRRNLRRNAILRANQVREIQGKSTPRRRTDMQHSRVISGANNNRKC